jgi:peptidoglycan/xylan/chitin deacetylase (PgdA/CDA1 family)
VTRVRPLLALKVDVDTLRGTREGVPRLADAFQRLGVGATFLFSVGPDHTGRAVKRVFRRGFVRKVTRTSVLSHYGLRTLLYGTLLPGPVIGESCTHEMRAVRDAGFEVGLHTWDHVKWQDNVGAADAAWTERQMRLGADAFHAVFGAMPRVHGAAGWQMNESAFDIELNSGFSYASDTRGWCPFVPVVAGRPIECPQVPTTLPTLDELIGRDGMDADRAASYLLRLTSEPPRDGHVHTLHAELEGMKLASTLARLLAGWISQGYEIVSIGSLLQKTNRARLPRHLLSAERIPGRSGTVMMQGPAWNG